MMNICIYRFTARYLQLRARAHYGSSAHRSQCYFLARQQWLAHTGPEGPPKCAVSAHMRRSQCIVHYYILSNYCNYINRRPVCLCVGLCVCPDFLARVFVVSYSAFVNKFLLSLDTLLFNFFSAPTPLCGGPFYSIFWYFWLFFDESLG